MANNRMALVCKDCKVGIAIAKYYPMVRAGEYEPLAMISLGGVDSDDNAGWYQQGNKTQDLINEFFIKHKHDYDFSNIGGSQYFLGYENDKKNWKYEN